MMQKAVFLLILFLTTSYAGYAGSYSGNYVGAGGNSGGYGYGYEGDAPPGFPHQLFQQIPFDFSTLLAGYLDALMKHHQILSENIQHIQNTVQKQAIAAGAGQVGGGNAYSGYGSGGGAPSYGSYGGGFGGSYGGGYGGSYSGSSGVPGGSFSSASGVPGGYGAGASASVGGDGGYQTAYLSPENPASPNVNVRFGAGGDGDGGKAYSVFTSSSSGSGNVDGKPYGFRRASTTINNNGKVSTYSVSD